MGSAASGRRRFPPTKRDSRQRERHGRLRDLHDVDIPRHCGCSPLLSMPFVSAAAKFGRSEMPRIRFNFAPAKVIDAVSWMLWVEEKNGNYRLDFQTILKSCYFADKEALVKRRRPIFGARYFAMQYGPVPTEIYQMLKCEPIWLVELAEENVTEYPWDQKNHFLSLKTKKKIVSNTRTLPLSK